MEIYYLITFGNTHHAIACEKDLQALGYQVRIIPVPPEITADCGLALRFLEADFEGLSPQLQAIPHSGLYKVVKNGKTKEVYLQ